MKCTPINALIRLLAILGVSLMCGNYSLAQQVQEIFEVKHDESPALRDIPQAPQIAGTPKELPILHLPHPPGRNEIDPVVQNSALAPLALEAPTSGVNFDGIGVGLGSYAPSSAPPDPNGSVGPNHYVQMVNTDFAVFNKSGVVLLGPVPINTIWAGFVGGCQTNNDGDPIVLYDKIADRWVITQFSVTTTPYLECVAVSTTPDPTGSYYRYAFSYGNVDFIDYPKVGVWPDAYYATYNVFANGTTFSGAKVCAWDRSKMLTGAAASQQCFQLSATWGGLLPSDFDGTMLPPAGSPNYLVSLDAPTSSNLLQYWKFHVDWTTPANTTLTGPVPITVAPYTNSCSAVSRGACIPQGGGGSNLESLADRIMHRFAYRNLGDHEALVVNHTVEVGSGSGLKSAVRWYELRPDASHHLSAFQQGTYAPDSNWRWMGSAAMDKAGNIAVGYSVSGSSLFPQIHFTGRLAGDAAGMMTQGENIIINGGGAQTGGLARWGDYSSMSVDPGDDCTFWYTNEYLKATGSFNWSTRIASFKLPSCAPTVGDYSLSVTPASRSVVKGSSTSYTATVTPTGGFTGTVTFSVSGLPAGAAGSFNPASVTPSGSSTLNVTTSPSTPSGSYPLTITGNSGSLTHTTSVTLVVMAVPTSTSVVSSVNPSVFGKAVTFTATVKSLTTGTPTGPVMFKDGAKTLGTGALSGGKATFTTAALTVGSHSITAVYGGDTNFAGSASAPLTQTVTQAGTSGTVSSSLNPSVFGKAVTFTATIKSLTTGTPTGPVTFKDGATTLGTAALSGGKAKFTTAALAVGTHSITAVYGGDANFTGSTSGVVTQTVTKAGTSGAVSSSLNPSKHGNSVTFTATIKSLTTGTPTGPVTFKDGATTLGTAALSGSKAKFTTAALTVGAHSITAVYGGDTSFTGSTSAALTQTVNP